MSTPLVSVIVPIYNTADFLPQCLDGLLAQTLKDIEIICVNDASTDGCAQILQNYAQKDERLHVITNSEHLGVSKSRNLAIKKSRADFLMFHDSDDTCEPEFCAKMYQAITEHNTDLAISEIGVTYHAHRELKMSDDEFYTLKYTGTQVITPELIAKTDCNTQNKIFRKSILEQNQIQFPDDLQVAEDAYFCTTYLCVSHTIYYLNERLYNYVRHDGSLTSLTLVSYGDKRDFAIDHLYSAMQIFEFLKAHELIGTYNKFFWHFFAGYEKQAVVSSKSSAAVKKAKQTAREFVDKNQEFFLQADFADQDQIKRFYTSGPYINTVRIKRFLLRFMPTYRLATDNIHRLMALGTKNQQLLERIDKLTPKE